jgi:hypothetical protein
VQKKKRDEAPRVVFSIFIIYIIVVVVCIVDVYDGGLWRVRVAVRGGTNSGAGGDFLWRAVLSRSTEAVAVRSRHGARNGQFGGAGENGGSADQRTAAVRAKSVRGADVPLAHGSAP